MTDKEKINRLRNIQRCTPIHTREDSRDFEALEAAIEDIETLDWIKNKLGNVFIELTEESIAKNWLMAVSGMSIEELTDAFTKGYRLVSPEEKNDQSPDIRVTAEEAAEAIQNLTKAGISQEDIESSNLPFYDPDRKRPEGEEWKMNDKNQVKLLQDAIKAYENGEIIEAKDKAIEFINNITDFEAESEE